MPQGKGVWVLMVGAAVLSALVVFFCPYRRIRSRTRSDGLLSVFTALAPGVPWPPACPGPRRALAPGVPGARQRPGRPHRGRAAGGVTRSGR